MKTQIESWEKPKIKKLVWKFVGAAMVGMVAIGAVAVFFSFIGWRKNPPTTVLLIIPWAILLPLAIQVAYHQGVCDERQGNKEER